MTEKVTIATVADRARVSRQTVSNVLNAPHLVREETRVRVQLAIDALGYRASQAARQMRTGRSRLIAVRIEPSQDGINGSVLDRFLHGLTFAAAPAGYRVVLYTAVDQESEIMAYDELLASHDLDGFVLTSTHHGDVRTSWLAARGIPFVTFGRPWSSHERDTAHTHPWVDVDGAAGTAEATARLLAAGHRRIGFIGWPPGSGVGDDRRAGWARSLAGAGIDASGLEWSAEDGVAEGGRGARDLLSRPDPPTALVCVSDSMALGVLGAGGGAGGVAVIGFDDTAVAAAVGLTSVSQPLTEAAAECVRLLTQVLDGPQGRSGHADGDQPMQVLLAPRLVVRRTG